MMKKNRFPLFIVGLPRSGTKLIRDILNNHNEINLPISESHFIPFFIRKYGLNPDFSNKEISSKFITDFINSTYSHNLSLKDKINIEEFRGILEINKWKDIFKYILCDLIFFEEHPPIWGDKTPGYVNHFDLIAQIFPNVRFLHIIRDPRDQVLSSKKLWNKNIYRSAQIWRDTIAKARDIVNKNSFNYLEVKYEDLTKSPESSIRKVCEFLHCDYKESMLIFKKSVENYGDTKGELTINNENSNKFLELFSKKQIRRIEQITYDIMISLDYQPININTKPKQLTGLEKTIYKIYDGYQSLKFHVLDKGIIAGATYFYRLHITSSWR